MINNYLLKLMVDTFYFNDIPQGATYFWMRFIRSNTLTMHSLADLYRAFLPVLKNILFRLA